MIPDEFMMPAVLMVAAGQIGQWTNSSERYEVERRLLWVLGVAGLRKNDGEITDLSRREYYLRSVLPSVSNLSRGMDQILSHDLNSCREVLHVRKSKSPSKNVSL